MGSISGIAKSWIGKEFNPGVGEQCMAFVRHILKEAASPFADKITEAPVDKLETNPMLASSLAGRDLGAPLTDHVPEFQPGSIVFFENTYGDWAQGTITHVGIYVGDRRFVHRPTSARPVELAQLSGYWYDKLRCALIIPDAEKVPGGTVKAPGGAPPAGGKPPEGGALPGVLNVRVWVHDGKSQVTVNGVPYRLATITDAPGHGAELELKRVAP